MRSESTDGLVARLRAILDGGFGGDWPPEEIDESVPREVLATLATGELLAAHVPSDFGGRGVDMTTYGELQATMASTSPALAAVLTVHNMVAEVILRLGSADQKHTWLPALVQGDCLAAFALTEPGVGSDASSVATTAVATDGGFRLTGQKKWVTYGQSADVFLIVARIASDDSIGAFLVPRDSPDISVVPVDGMLGLRAAMLADLRLDDCEIPEDHRIGTRRLPPGIVAGTALHHGRFSVAWGSLGIGEACLRETLAFSEERQQFGVPLSDHQLIRRLLTNMITDTRAGRLLCEHAGSLWARRDAGSIQATLIAKYFNATMANRVADSAVQIHGARGVTDSSSVARHYRDARVMEIIEGSNEMHQLLIAEYGLRMARIGRSQ